MFHLSNGTTFQVLKQGYCITAWGSSIYCRSLQQSKNGLLKILLKMYQHNKQLLQYDLIYGNTNNARANNLRNITNIKENNTNINTHPNTTNLKNTNLYTTNSNNTNVNYANINAKT